jgi:hypothetical protein
MDLDLRRTAVYAGRVRVGIGLALMFAPRLSMRGWAGPSVGTSGGKLVTRALGAREAVIGAGTAIAAAERNGGGSWLSMAALADAADAVFTFTDREVPVTGRIVGVVAAASAVGHLLLAQALAEQEGAARV